ncbi:TPA: hypothetical protein ACH3X1_008273 [Trebouxia sp. C0004]
MVNKPSTVDEATAHIWDLPNTVLKPSEKHSLTALLAEKTDAVARRYFSAPGPELWVGTLKELIKPTDIPKKRRLPSSYADRRRKLPSASGMNLTIMRQQQGVMMYDDVTQKSRLVEMDSPLYMNYRCNANQEKDYQHVMRESGQTSLSILVESVDLLLGPLADQYQIWH